MYSQIRRKFAVDSLLYCRILTEQVTSVFHMISVLVLNINVTVKNSEMLKLLRVFPPNTVGSCR